MDRNEQIRQAAVIWLAAESLAQQEGKAFEKKLRENRVATTKEGKILELFAQEGKVSDEKLRENGLTTEEVKIQTFEEALRERGVTKEEISKRLDELAELGESDPADEQWNSEDTRVLLGWLGVLAVAIILVIFAWALLGWLGVLAVAIILVIFARYIGAFIETL
jgi:hypothetical protein